MPIYLTAILHIFTHTQYVDYILKCQTSVNYIGSPVLLVSTMIKSENTTDAESIEEIKEIVSQFEGDSYMMINSDNMFVNTTTQSIVGRLRDDFEELAHAQIRGKYELEEECIESIKHNFEKLKRYDDSI